jgi:hypothetical protein
MPLSIRSAAAFVLAAFVSAADAARAQDDAPQTAPAATPQEAAQAPAPQPAPRFVQLRYPQDKETVIAIADGSPIWLSHLVEHIDARHYPGFERLMAGEDGNGSADGRRILASDLIAPWVRQFADIKALEAEARSRSRGPVDQEKIEACLSAALKKSFEEYLKAYTDDLAQRGLPTELSQKRVDRLLTDFQFRFGLSCELQGWLDYLQPEEDWSNARLNDFFQNNPRYFGGGVTVQHILVQNRDPGTGILLQEQHRIAAAARLSEVQKRVLPDGSNFSELAQQFSDDTRSAKDGGKLENVERFDQRMPTVLCRAAWKMKDGEISGVVESQYGWHIVRRVEHVQRMFMLFSDATIPMVKQLLQRELQEDLLFSARKSRAVELKL